MDNVFKLTSIRVKPYDNETSKIKAFVDVTLNDELVIRGLRVVDGKNGRFLAFPTIRKEDKKMYDICYPITKELKEYFETEIFKKYDMEIKEAKE